MSETRVKPFVAFAYKQINAPDCARGGAWRFSEKPDEYYTVPVVVTPLLPDDPKVGEVWEWNHKNQMMGQAVEIFGAPYVCSGDVVVPFGRDGKCNGAVDITRLRRPPVMKTFAFTVPDGDTQLVLPRHVRMKIQAESKEAAIAKLTESLEEMP